MRYFNLLLIFSLLFNTSFSQEGRGSQVVMYHLPTNLNGLTTVTVSLEWQLSINAGDIVLSFASKCKGNTQLNYKGKIYTGYSSADNMIYGRLSERIRDIHCTDPTVAIHVTGPGMDKRIKVKVHEAGGSGASDANSVVVGKAQQTDIDALRVEAEEVVSVVFENASPAFAEAERISAEKEKRARTEQAKKQVSAKVDAGDYSGALLLLRSMQKNGNDDGWVTEEIGKVEKLKKDHEIEMARLRDKARADEYLKEAGQMMASNKYESARDLLNKAEKLNPSDPRIAGKQAELTEIQNKKALEKSSSASAKPAAKGVASSAAADQDFWEDRQAEPGIAIVDKKTKPRQNSETINGLGRKQQVSADKVENTGGATPEKAGRQDEVYSNSFYARLHAGGGEKRIDSSVFSRKYASIEELEADYAEKINAVDKLEEDPKQAKGEKPQADKNQVSRNANGKDKLFGEVVALAGSLFNEVNGEKEEKKRKEMLEKQKADLRLKLERERTADMAALLTGLRRQILIEYPDGGMPLSRDSIPVNELYFFAYGYDTASVADQTVSMALTNLFSVGRYSDGTWPFKNEILKEIKEAGPEIRVLMGYYGNPKMAEHARNSFIGSCKKAGFAVKDVAYAGKPYTGGNKTNGDFWETGAPSTGSRPSGKAASKNNAREPGTKKNGAKPAAKPSAKPAQKDDFWNN